VNSFCDDLRIILLTLTKLLFISSTGRGAKETPPKTVKGILYDHILVIKPYI